MGMLGTVTVDAHAYAALLVKAEETDPAAWPEELREGAALLAKIRGFEEACRQAHGKWDWELLPEAEQDEYDDACALLDRLLEPEVEAEWEALKAERRRALGL